MGVDSFKLLSSSCYKPVNMAYMKTGLENLTWARIMMLDMIALKIKTLIYYEALTVSKCILCAVIT